MKLKIKTTIETQVEKEVEIEFPYYTTDVTGWTKTKTVETEKGLLEWQVTLYSGGDISLSIYTAKSVCEKTLVEREKTTEEDFNAHLKKVRIAVEKYFSEVGEGNSIIESLPKEKELNRDKSYLH